MTNSRTHIKEYPEVFQIHNYTRRANVLRDVK